MNVASLTELLIKTKPARYFDGFRTSLSRVLVKQRNVFRFVCGYIITDPLVQEA